MFIEQSRVMQVRFALIRLLSQGIAKPFVGAVDKTQYPEYYELIKTPVDLGLIAERMQLVRFVA